MAQPTVSLRSIAISIALVLFVGIGNANAASYTDVSGSTVDFDTISDQNALYGQPTAAGNSLNFFLSPNFMADTDVNTPEATNTTDTVFFTIQGQGSGQLITGIESIALSEQGDFSVLALPGGFAQVTSNGDISILIEEIDGAVLTTPIQEDLNFTITYTPNVGAGTVSGTAYSVFSTGAPVIDNGSWDGTINIDINQILLDNLVAPTARATRVKVSLENELIATVFGPGSAGIDKDFFTGGADMTVQVNTVVPEPGTALLVGLGLAGLARVGRRR